MLTCTKHCGGFCRISLEDISKVIHERMQREEEKLYPLYLQIAAPN